MKVTRIHTGWGSSHIEPPMDPGWSDFEKLQWYVATVIHDMDLPEDAIEIKEYPTNYNLILRAPTVCNSIAVTNYASIWSMITGVELGIALARRLG